VKPVEELSQVLGPATDILIRIEHIPHIESHGGLRHQLHEPDRASPGHGSGIEI